jgi:hypothetical protein
VASSHYWDFIRQPSWHVAVLGRSRSTADELRPSVNTDIVSVLYHFQPKKYYYYLFILIFSSDNLNMKIDGVFRGIYKVNFTNVKFSHIYPPKKKILMIKFTNIIKYEFFLFLNTYAQIEFLWEKVWINLSNVHLS